MGQRCTKRWITEEDIQISKQIDSSFSVRKENACTITCISAAVNPYVERDEEKRDIENNESQITDKEVLFDGIDHALSVSFLFSILQMVTSDFIFRQHL